MSGDNGTVRETYQKDDLVVYSISSKDTYSWRGNKGIGRCCYRMTNSPVVKFAAWRLEVLVNIPPDHPEDGCQPGSWLSAFPDEMSGPYPTIEKARQALAMESL